MYLKSRKATQSLFAGLSSLLLLSLSGCPSSRGDNLREKPALPSEPQGALEASPLSVCGGGAVTLSFPSNHPKHLSVKTPSGSWVVIHDAALPLLLLPEEEYTNTTEITFNSGQLEGVSWVNGLRLTQKVFENSGEYLFYMADNLETEPENTFHFFMTLNYQGPCPSK